MNRAKQVCEALRGTATATVTANGIIVRAVAYAKQEDGERRDKGKERERGGAREK